MKNAAATQTTKLTDGTAVLTYTQTGRDSVELTDSRVTGHWAAPVHLDLERARHSMQGRMQAGWKRVQVAA